MDKQTVTARAQEKGAQSAGVVAASEMQRWPKRYSWIFLAGIVLVGVLVVFAYLPGLHGSFYYDDFRSIIPSNAVYAQRAKKVLDDNRPRFAGHEDQLRALKAYETSFRKATGGGEEDR